MALKGHKGKRRGTRRGLEVNVPDAAILPEQVLDVPDAGIEGEVSDVHLGHCLQEGPERGEEVEK